MTRLLIFLLPALLLLGGCAGQKPAKRAIESISANTGAAMSSYPTASSVVDGDKALISKSTASNATQQAAMSTIKDYVLSDVIDFSATSPLNFNSTTGVLSLTPWASQSELETWLGWAFSGSGGGVAVSSALPTTSGSAALNDSTHILTVASDTGYTQFTGSFTAWDTTPEAFGFGTITDAVAGQEYCWITPVTVADINNLATVASTADSYKINDVVSTATSIALGDTFTPCMVASSTAGATVSGNMTVGGVAGDPSFSVTTAAASCSTISQQESAAFSAYQSLAALATKTYTEGSFVATETTTLCGVDVYVGKTGIPTNNVTAAIYTDNAGVPGTLIGSVSDPITATAMSSEAYTPKFSGLNAPVTVGTRYHVVFHSVGDVYDAANYIRLGSTDTAGNGMRYSSNGTSWSYIGDKTIMIRTYK